MKMLVYSDLHNEFAPFEPPPTDADIIVLAGDIDTKARGVAWANEVFSQPSFIAPATTSFTEATSTTPCAK